MVRLIVLLATAGMLASACSQTSESTHSADKTPAGSEVS
jgi:hypothetical protein